MYLNAVFFLCKCFSISANRINTSLFFSSVKLNLIFFYQEQTTVFCIILVIEGLKVVSSTFPLEYPPVALCKIKGITVFEIAVFFY